jgi:branched-subunit amino acid aminotransferase/4-amino-4-deoxychorismate lyase
MDNSRSDIGLCSDKKIFETGTSNILFVRNNKLYSPGNNCYKGITYKFFESKVKKINKKDIMIDTFSKYDEIILIGSGKGVASVKTVDKIRWKRKSLKTFNLLNNQYSLAAKKYPRY